MVQKTEPLANESNNVQNISQGTVATRLIIIGWIDNDGCVINLLMNRTVNEF